MNIYSCNCWPTSHSGQLLVVSGDILGYHNLGEEVQLATLNRDQTYQQVAAGTPESQQDCSNEHKC